MRTQTKRPGFTLIELMVAMALTLFIMTILSQAFVMSIETFSGMKGIGDMQQNLRTASILLRDDLIEDHFEGKRRLSDVAAIPTGTGRAAGVVSVHPQQGFFAVLQKTSAVAAATATFATPYVNEGNDASGMPSHRAFDQMLYMTVKRKGNRTENFFSNALLGDAVTLGMFFSQSTAYNIPASPNMPYSTLGSPYVAGATQGFYNSQWAEVIYYLVQTGTTEEPNNPASVTGTPTFGLYRAQFGMVPDATSVNGKFSAGLESTTFAQMSCNPAGVSVAFYTPSDAALGQRVVPDLVTLTTPPPARIVAASTLVLPNVTAFHIRVKTLPTTAAALATAPNFADVPLITAQTYRLYDTTKLNQAGYNNNFGIKGIQITLRVWDPKTRQTRQITVVQDL